MLMNMPKLLLDTADLSKEFSNNHSVWQPEFKEHCFATNDEQNIYENIKWRKNVVELFFCQLLSDIKDDVNSQLFRLTSAALQFVNIKAVFGLNSFLFLKWTSDLACPILSLFSLFRSVF